MVSPTDGWAVGMGNHGIILHWDGNSWVEVPSPADWSLQSVAIASTTDGWIVGDQGNILRWDGNTWKDVTSPTSNPLNSVAMVSAADG
jgi:photosystem II stability/assembly factor-like uncharacterized protein